MRNMESLRLVEASVSSLDGRVAIGIMNVRQALDLPDIPSLAYSHPEADQANAGVLVSRNELRSFLQARACASRQPDAVI